MPHFLITTHRKSRKMIGSDGFDTHAINETPAAWLLKQLQTRGEVDVYYEKPRIVFSEEITADQYEEFRKNL